ncbi:sensor domain-containing diguanylate cyclase [Simiduia aestuariiviva]|uniref:diguanylate cyclase n=1 Tax=Simiduia aestuariiviva TaxID=1510459 RepID=A0A839UL49_9GAMM|nr:sensor domain-containing diguanylate cyclase [Simiduia aestuariiviva]MBB3168884.1 diguanylate cyclase (GGDEF)-like protein/PAS domain S-box-containing protein [Simiduia aestuariiviva]
MEMREIHWLMDMVTHIDLGLVVFDRQGKIAVWNHFMENHSGLSSTEMREQCLFDVYPELKKDWFQRELDTVLLLENEVFITWEQVPHLMGFAAYRPITAKSHYMYQNVVLRAIRSASGETDLVSMTLYDVTDIASNKLALESANKELAILSRTDRLTGLFNRGYWQEQLESSWALHKRYNRLYSLVIFDIDHFKKVNDTYGHQAGDEVIKLVAELVQDCARDSDCVGRYGGEEFTVILPHTDAEGGRVFAERLRKIIEAQEVVHEEHTIKFTISLGVAEISPHFGSETGWLEAADQALYQCKHGGRNQTCIAPTPEPPK